MSIGSITISNVVFSIHTLLYCMMSIIVGTNMVFFYIFTKLYAQKSHFIPKSESLDWVINISVDKGILTGAILVCIGIIVSISSFIFWAKTGFGQMDPESLMRFLLPAATMIEVGMEMLFAFFFIGILQIEWKED